MQLNNSENWKQDLINHGVAIIDLTQKSGSMIYCGEQSDTSGNFQIKSVKDEFLFSFEHNEDEIQILCYLIRSDSQFYSLYYKFEKKNNVRKEISRSNVFGYDLYDYVDWELQELETWFENKYNELIDICLKIRNSEI